MVAEHSLRYLDSTQVDALCRGIDPLEVATDTLLAVRRGTAGITPEAALRWQAPDGTAARSLVLPAHQDDTYGCKIINACIGNPDRGLPRASGLILLFDLATAAPVCVMEGGRISALRTAAVSIVALRAIRDVTAIRRVAFLGCGRQARSHLELLTTLTKPAEVIMYDQEPLRAKAFAEEARAELQHAAVVVATSAESATRRADVVIAVTTTTTPYVELDWLPEGAVFLNVSLDDATEELLLGCDRLIVDDWELVRDDDTRLLGRLAQAGRVSGPGEAAPPGARAVDADLAGLLGGDAAAMFTDRQRIVVNPFGMGVHDIALAARVYQAAVDTGVGIALPR